MPLVRCNCSRAPRIVPSIRALSDHSMLRVRRRGAPYGLPPRKWERSEALSALWFVGLAVVPRAACPTCASRIFPQFMFAPVGRFRQIPPQPPRSTSGPPKDKRKTPRSTFGAPKDECKTLRSTFGAPKDERRTPRSTFGAPRDERRTPRSTFGALRERDERRTPRSMFGAPRDQHRTPRSTFWAPKYKRRTPRSMFVVPQDEGRTLCSMYVRGCNK